MAIAHTQHLVGACCLILVIGDVAASTSKKSSLGILQAIRKRLNLSDTLGSPLHSKNPYDRIMGSPVFAVTTPWGSPYLNMEKLNDLEETVPSQEVRNDKKNIKSLSEEQNEIRMVALYFTDPDDALSMQSEMKQLENLKESDIRVSTFSLAKAIRQASNLGNGLTTGAPVDETTGKFSGTDGRLRYKIVPSKRQLYYAARCIGKERVGLCGATAQEDATLSIVGNSALEASNLMRRIAKRDASRISTQRSNNPMEGYSGIPVFTCAAMQKRKLGRTEMPYFLNYEDLLSAWDKVRGNKPRGTPPVEVFNLMDVLTSMDRGDKRLQKITFVPSSRSVEYKERISSKGNGKARLKPMR